MTGTAAGSAAPDAVTPEEAARFRAACTQLWPAGDVPGTKLGLAVSGGPDSLALLLLASAARPGAIEAASVDHGLRTESAGEAAMVADVCERLDVPHRTLAVTVAAGNVQDQARQARYTAFGEWARERGIHALATAHHADDQAETLLMRLNRSSGVAGLAGIRAIGHWPQTGLMLLRPLLAWRKGELAAIVSRAGLAAAQDPSNQDPRFDRARIRSALAAADWLDPAALARAAGHLADAEEALSWAALREWDENVVETGEGYRWLPAALPRAIRVRIVEMAVGTLGGEDVRGGAAARLADELSAGGKATLGGTVIEVKKGVWTFRPEPPRRTG
jgi:tRNA(Ile)-lysidine synthase